ncbi:hypothetical protein F0M18_17250 [Pseudohalioglobus sediminis]|uniref:Uncharacterized protein n=1 Tax=Pseudohalioglobus sediminis TaxID=2606449 RepID=A0A5B0WSX6_9GAMM|nr:hypothetical protein [Pseudohalioglobus sediminis]KAA1188949.1 hypothetical protein F0M18_17250 [Pseudohalioglobus sediminis]
MAMRPLALIPLALLLALAWQAQAKMRQHLAFTQLETEVSFWGRGAYLPTERTRERTGAGIEQLVAATPKDARAHALQASQLAWESYWQQSGALAKEAIKAQKQALDWRPAHPQDQRLMVEYQSRNKAM